MLKKIPHTYVIVFSIIVLSAILTWIVPGGAFDRQIVTVNGIDRNVVIPGSFHFIDRNPQTWQIFSALFEGFVDKADIVVFILIIGGAFWIMNESKAIDVAIRSVLRFSKKMEHNRFISGIGADNLIFFLIMIMFSIFGAVFGMSEETIAFVIIFVPLSISMGYDSIVGVSLCFVAAALGFAGAILNPFTIGIAQGLSNLPLFSGIEYRMFCWAIINLAGFWFILRYAGKVKKNPSISKVKADDKYWLERRESDNSHIVYHTPVSARIMYVILILIMGIFSWQNTMTDISIGEKTISFPAIPLITGLFLITGWLSLRRSVHFFILQILLITILLLITGVMGYGWYIMEIATLFFAMGLMSQFSDLIGVSRQATVMAYQFGDGFTNIITPTSGVLLGVLSVARIPYEKWFRWVLPLVILLIIIGFILLIPTVYLRLNGF